MTEFFLRQRPPGTSAFLLLCNKKQFILMAAPSLLARQPGAGPKKFSGILKTSAAPKHAAANMGPAAPVKTEKCFQKHKTCA